MLMSYGGDVNAKLVSRDIESNMAPGSTPLHYASRFNMLNVIFLLVMDGNADLTVKDYQGKTPLDLATNEETRWGLFDFRIVLERMSRRINYSL